MFDLTYSNQLKYVTVTAVTTNGDAEELAQVVEKWDAESEPEYWDEWPKFGVENADKPLIIAFDAEEAGSSGTVTWECEVDLSALDWPHLWSDRSIMAAEAIYREHRDPTDTRWTLPHIEADALRFLRECVADACGLMTPMDADRLMRMFLCDAMPAAAEELEEPDHICELLAEAVEDAKPISTGIAQLDSILGGGLHKGLSVIAGDPSAGKTALAVQLALYAANQHDGTVLYCMADQGGRGSALLRMISCAASICDVEGCELSHAGEWDARELYEGRRAFDRIAKGRVVLLDKTELAEAVSQLNYHARKSRVSLVALDFAQAMTYDGHALAFDPEAASEAVRELRAWAHAHNAVVLLLSAYSKSAREAHARGAAPSMTDVLGSAELAYSAEHVLALANPYDGRGTVTARDLKHRHAGNASQADRGCTLTLDAEHGRFI